MTSVVALGGGHGLAAALRAVRRYAGAVTAVVSVADDGGSSGRLRREMGIPPPGDLRKCLVALAEDESVWAPVMEHRFSGGDLDGHALGNLVIAGLTETLGDFGRAVDEVAALLGVVGTVVPATTEPVVLKAEIDGTPVEGQVAVSRTPGRIRRVEIVPADARAPGHAVQAIVEADQVVLAPGSLFTSLIPVLCVADLRSALAESTARIVQVCNLASQHPETDGLDDRLHRM
ncbi:MAG TPA: gluconeogenesis factor YvcK family protein, partial [Acidimicrobiia bacterium]|nr:gluconeogenesis factor YvcK family protein [Acidimicrobiia bacterium]